MALFEWTKISFGEDGGGDYDGAAVKVYGRRRRSTAISLYLSVAITGRKPCPKSLCLGFGPSGRSLGSSGLVGPPIAFLLENGASCNGFMCLSTQVPKDIYLVPMPPFFPREGEPSSTLKPREAIGTTTPSANKVERIRAHPSAKFKMYQKLAAISALLATVRAQQVCTLTTETHPSMTWKKCASGGSCATQNGQVVIDANWRWLHSTSGTQNCYTGSSQDSLPCLPSIVHGD